MVSSSQKLKFEDNNIYTDASILEAFKIVDTEVRDSSYLDILNVVLPKKSELETFLRTCSYVTLAEIPAESYLEQSQQYEQKMLSTDQDFSFYTFLNTLETILNTKRQYLARDFSNYTEVLTSEQVQELHAVVPQTQARALLQTLFTFTLDDDAVFLQLLLQYWPQLVNGKLFDTCTTVLQRCPLPPSFEFGLKYLDLSHEDQWLLVDIRILYVLGFKYLAQHLRTYNKLKQQFSAKNIQLIQDQI